VPWKKPPSGQRFVERLQVSGWSRSKELLDRAAAKIVGEPLGDWRVHDLRRSVATGLQRLGVAAGSY
jgi:hypothetical protein